MSEDMKPSNDLPIHYMQYLELIKRMTSIAGRLNEIESIIGGTKRKWRDEVELRLTKLEQADRNVAPALKFEHCNCGKHIGHHDTCPAYVSGARVEALSIQINPQDDGVLDNTNKHIDDTRLLKAITTRMEEYGMPVFVDRYTPAMDILQLVKDAGYSKTERCELDEKEVRGVIIQAVAKARSSGLSKISHNDKALTFIKEEIFSHFTATNVKDDRDKLIVAMKEEILILRANVKQLEDEQHQKLLSVDDTYQFMCDHIEWQGNNAPNLRKLAKQLHQHIYGETK